MKLIVGLGNLGRDYEKTRHNIGFLCLEYLRKQYGFPDWKEAGKFKAEISEGNYLDEKVILCRPLTFMNLSGEAVILVKNFYKVELEDIIVIYDDVALPFGKLRFRPEGSAGGQNGMRSIIQQLGTEKVPRIRIGVEVREEDSKIETKDFVLSRLRPEELNEADNLFQKVSGGIDTYIEKGSEKTMEILN